MREVAIQRIHDVMTAKPLTVHPDSAVRELLEIFDRYDYNVIPVVDDQGVLRGIVTKLEVLRLIQPAPDIRIEDGERLKTTRVTDIMRRGVITVDAEQPVAAALDLLVDTRLRALPVIEHGPAGAVVVGMVSVGDLLRTLRAELDEGRFPGP